MSGLILEILQHIHPKGISFEVPVVKILACLPLEVRDLRLDLERVRKIQEVNPQTKVIFISGFSELENLKRELDEEILRYRFGTLSKPFKIGEMLALVKTYVHGSQNRQPNVGVYA